MPVSRELRTLLTLPIEILPFSFLLILFLRVVRGDLRTSFCCCCAGGGGVGGGASGAIVDVDLRRRKR